MAYRDEILADFPVIYYEFEETSGTTLADSSGNGRDATIIASGGYPIFSEAFAFTGNGIGFDNNLGSGIAFAEGRVTTPLDMFGVMDSTVSFTVEAVVNLHKSISGSDGYDIVYCISDDAGSIFQFCLLSPDYTSDVPRIGMFYNGGRLHVGNEYPNDNLEHLVQWTWDAAANTITTWIDGVKGPSEDMTFSLTWAAVAGSVVAGLYSSGSSHNGFRGAISELSLFSYILNDDRLIAHADADGLAPPPPPIAIVTGISPTTGPAAGGTDVTITGSGFLATTDVQFGGDSVPSGSVVDDNTLDVTSPPHDAGAVHVQVITDGGPSDTSSDDLFTYIGTIEPPPPPEVSGGDQNAADGRASGVGSGEPVPRKKVPVRTDGVPKVEGSGSHGLVPQVSFRAAVYNGTHVVYGDRLSMEMPKEATKLGVAGWTVYHSGQLTGQQPNTGDANGTYNIFMTPEPIYFQPPVEADGAATGFLSLFINLTSLTIDLTGPLYYCTVSQSGLNLTLESKPQLLTDVGAFGFGSELGADHPNGALISYADLTGVDIPMVSAPKIVPAGNYQVSPGVYVAVPQHTLTFTIPDIDALDDLPDSTAYLRVRACKGGKIGALASPPVDLLEPGSIPTAYVPFFNSNYGVTYCTNFDSDDPNYGLVLYRVNADQTIDFDLDRLTVANGDFLGIGNSPEIQTYAVPMDNDRIVIATAETGAGFQVVRHTGTTLSLGPVFTQYVTDFRGTRIDPTHFCCQHYLFQINSDDTIELVTDEFGNNIGTASYFPFALSGGAFPDLTNAFVHQIDGTHLAQNHMPQTNTVGLGIGVYSHNFIDAHLDTFDSDEAAPNPDGAVVGIPFLPGGRTEETKYFAQFLGGKCPATGNGNEMLLAELTFGTWVKPHPTTQAGSRAKGQSMRAIEIPHMTTGTEPSSGKAAFPPTLQALGNVTFDPDEPFIITSNTVDQNSSLSLAGNFYTPGATITQVKFAGVLHDVDGGPYTVSASGNWGGDIADVGSSLGLKNIVVRDSSGKAAATTITVVVPSP